MANEVTLTASMRANLYSLQQTAQLMGTVQQRLATGKKVNSALDNPNNYFAAQALSNRANDISSLLDGMGQAIQTIKSATQGIESAKKLVDQMKAVATSAMTTVGGNNATTGPKQLGTGNGVAITSGTAAGATKLSDLVDVNGDTNGGPIKEGDVLTIGNGLKTASITATASMTVGQLVDAINNAGFSGLTATVNSNGSLSFENTSLVDVHLSGSIQDKLGLAATIDHGHGGVTHTSTMAELGIADFSAPSGGQSKLEFKIGGGSWQTIDLSPLNSNSTLDDMASLLTTQLKAAGTGITVTANGANGRLQFSGNTGGAIVFSGLNNTDTAYATQLGLTGSPVVAAQVDGAASGGAITPPTVGSSTLLRDIGLVGADLANNTAKFAYSLNGGAAAAIDISGLSTSSTLQDVADAINTQFTTDNVNVTATVDGNKLRFTSTDTRVVTFAGTAAAVGKLELASTSVAAETKGSGHGTGLSITTPGAAGTLAALGIDVTKDIVLHVGNSTTTLDLDGTAGNGAGNMSLGLGTSVTTVDDILTLVNNGLADINPGTTATAQWDAVNNRIEIVNNDKGAISFTDSAGTNTTKLGIDGSTFATAVAAGSGLSGAMSVDFADDTVKLSALGITSSNPTVGWAYTDASNVVHSGTVTLTGITKDSTLALFESTLQTALRNTGESGLASITVGFDTDHLTFDHNIGEALTLGGTAAGLLRVDGADLIPAPTHGAGNGSVVNVAAVGSAPAPKTLYTVDSSQQVSGSTALSAVNSATQSAITNGDTMVVAMGNGPSTTITVGAGANQVDTMSELVTQLNKVGGIQATLDNGKLTISSTNGQGITLSGNLADKLGVSASYSATGSAPAGTYITQFDGLRSQLDQLVRDSGYQGINLISGSSNSPLTVVFNEAATDAAKLVINAVDLSSDGLGISEASGNWSTSSAVQAALTQLTNAANTLRDQAQKLGTNLATVQTRQDFATNMIATLKEGADKLTLADMNEEGANMLALQTRSQLGTQSLSLASQANQAVMRLFG